MNTFAGVIFDNDGTLVDSSEPVRRCWVAWANEYGIDPRSLAGYHGVPAADIVAELVPAEDVEAALARIDHLELTDVDGVVALPGTVEAVAAISPPGLTPLHAVATSAMRELAALRLKMAGIDPPAAFVAIEDVVRGKPDPEPFLLAAERLGLDPTQCLVCEDAPSGIAAAKAAGCTVLAVTTTSTREELGDADLVVDRLDEVRFIREGDRVRLERMK